MTLCALDNGNCVILITLDLSASFDTIDHKIFWYLWNSHIQCVTIDGVKSTEK